MAATITAAATIVGLGTSSLSSAPSLSSPSRISLGSGFLKPLAVRVRDPRMKASARVMKITCEGSFKGDWLRTDLNVIGFGLIGWIAPSSIPAINGNSLTGLFLQSIGDELSHFPTPPALTSQFWLWLVLWHLGLFLSLTFGQIGFKGREEEYF